MHSVSFLPLSPINCQSEDYIPKILPDVILQMEQQGFSLVQMRDTSESSLLAITSCLGRSQSHIRSDQNGIALVTSQAQTREQRIDLSQYHGTTNKEFSPHTDGAALDGIFRDGDSVRRLVPPKIVAMQCVRPAMNGGTSQLVDMQRVLRDLIISDSEVAQILSRPGCVFFCRDEQIASAVPIFESMSINRWRVRFRGDANLYAPSWSYEAVQHLQVNYLSNSEYQKRIDLKEGQILLVDNLRVLHGREAFELNCTEHNRLLRRVWIHDEEGAEVLLNFANSMKDCRAFERFASYGAIGRKSKPSLLLQLGIRLPSQLGAVINKPVLNPAA